MYRLITLLLGAGAAVVLEGAAEACAVFALLAMAVVLVFALVCDLAVVSYVPLCGSESGRSREVFDSGAIVAV